MKETRKKTKEAKFTIRMQKKLVVLFGLVLLAFAGLGVRLILINRDDGEEYKKQILEQQEYSSKTLPARRGDILDSKGTPLAVSEKIYNLVIDAKVITSKTEYFEPTMKALDACFDLDMTAIRSHVKENSTSAYYVPVKGLTYEQIAPFLEMKNDTEKNPNIKGIWFEEEYTRNYPNGSLACDVIGFTTTDNNGTYGLEEYYNDILNGTAGREYGYLNEDSALERTTKPAVDGYNIVTTLDANVQSIIEKYLFAFNEEHKNVAREGNGANNLGCIIMDVNNGNVLGMGSYPNFNLNDTKNTDALLGMPILDETGKRTGEYINAENISTISEDPEVFYRQLNALWKNFCISDTYEPGSTIKPFTVATGLETGRITGNEGYQCDGSLVVVESQKPVRCHNFKYGGCGYVNVKQAVEQSCNVALMHIGMAIGKELFTEYQQNFNFGLKTNVDLAGEARTAGVVYTADKMGIMELATCSFGQGFNATMIQVITGFCSLINGGYYYEPHMVSKIVSSNGSTIKNIEPRVLRQTISKATSDKIIDYCNGVVTEGTGKAARPAGYAIGGKTGTAETTPRGNDEYVVSFLGYAPADDPQIAIYVVVDRVNDYQQDNVKLAATLVRDIFTEVLPYLGIYMTEELSEQELKELQEKQLEITRQYTTPPEDSVSDNEEGANGNGAESGAKDQGDDASQAGDNGDNEEDKEPNTPWKNFPIDPETGYAVNPETGEKVDPDTGQPVGENFSAFD